MLSAQTEKCISIFGNRSRLYGCIQKCIFLFHSIPYKGTNIYTDHKCIFSNLKLDTSKFFEKIEMHFSLHTKSFHLYKQSNSCLLHTYYTLTNHLPLAYYTTQNTQQHGFPAELQRWSSTFPSPLVPTATRRAPRAAGLLAHAQPSLGLR